MKFSKTVAWLGLIALFLSLSAISAKAAPERVTAPQTLLLAVKSFVEPEKRLSPAEREGLKAFLKDVRMTPAASGLLREYFDAKLDDEGGRLAVIELLGLPSAEVFSDSMGAWVERLLDAKHLDVSVALAQHLLGKAHVVRRQPRYTEWVDKLFARYNIGKKAFTETSIELGMLEHHREGLEALIRGVVGSQDVRRFDSDRWQRWVDFLISEIGKPWTVIPEYTVAEVIVGNPELFTHPKWESWVERFLTNSFSAQYLVRFVLNQPALMAHPKYVAWLDRAVALGAAGDHAVLLDEGLVRGVLSSEELARRHPEQWDNWVRTVWTRGNATYEFAWALGTPAFVDAYGPHAHTLVRGYVSTHDDFPALELLRQDFIRSLPFWSEMVEIVRERNRIRFWNLWDTRSHKRRILAEVEKLVSENPCAKILE